MRIQQHKMQRKLLLSNVRIAEKKEKISMKGLKTKRGKAEENVALPQ